MPISDKTRKILWGRSANRCAICKKELVIEATSVDFESVVGEECHIVSGQHNGPRYKSEIDKSIVDEYSNLLLLCRIDHKRIDDQVEAFPSERLVSIKQDHEKWVKDTLERNNEPSSIRIKKKKGGTPEFVLKIETGKRALDIVTGAMAFSFDHDEFKNEYDADTVGSFFQDLNDWADIHLEPSETIRVAFDLSKRIKEMEENGIVIFGEIETRIMEGGNSGPQNWRVAIMKAMYADNPLIIKIDPNDFKKTE